MGHYASHKKCLERWEAGSALITCGIWMKLQQGKGEPSLVVTPYSVCREPALDIAEKASGRWVLCIVCSEQGSLPTSTLGATLLKDEDHCAYRKCEQWATE